MALVATHILSDETGKDIVSAINLIASKMGASADKTYTAKWNTVTAQMERADDSENIM